MIRVFKTPQKKLIDCGWFYLLVTKDFLARIPKPLVDMETKLFNDEKRAYKQFWQVRK